MSSSTYASINQMKKVLKNYDAWLVKGVEHAKKKNVDPNLLGTSRLILDQYPLIKQIQSACDGAKFAAARLSGKEAPKHPDTETTIEELRARLRVVIEYLGTFKDSDFAGADDRLIELSFLEGKKLKGKDYLNELVLPNFYFHATTGYAILRANGVDLGKMDYIGELTFTG